MKAVMIRKYGGPEVLELAEVPAPKAGDREVVVKVHATSVNPIDWLLRDGGAKSFIKVTFPVILGCDLAGEIVEVGAGAKRFAVGDRVFAQMPQDWGAHAERVALSEDLVAKLPAGATMEEGAGLGVVSLTALNGLREHGHVQPGQRVLINGASSAVGMAAVQIGKVLGARVIAVCSGANFEMVKRLGADELIDYKVTDFTTGKETYDLVFDCVGTAPYERCGAVLGPVGIHVTTKPGVRTLLRQVANPFFRRKVHALMTTGNGERLEYIKSLVEGGQLKLLIDRVLPIAEVAQAQEYSKSGRAKGKIILQFPT